jgi:transposase
MEVIVKCVAGIDVHQKVLGVCILKGSLNVASPKPIQFTEGTTVKELENLATVLKSHGVTHIFMESTSQYWVPVYNVLLEYGFEAIVLANPQRIRGIPGRKTDMSDSHWIATLGRVGLIPPSYLPSKTSLDFRRYTRTRSRLVKNRSQQVNRVHNILQNANIKLTSYLSDVFGKTGMALMDMLIKGEEISIEKIENIMHGKIKATPQQLKDAMNGRFTEVLLEELDVNLSIISALSTQIIRLDKLIEDYTSKFQETYDRLIKIPGISKNIACVILAEIGDNVDGFNSSNALAKWTGLCPGNYESAGISKSGRTTKGNKYLKEALYNAGRTAAHSNSIYFSSFYQRIKAKGSKQKAVIATSHKMLKIVYKILKDKVDYNQI